MKSASSLLFTAWGLISFFKNLFVPQSIKRTLKISCDLSFQFYDKPERNKVEDNGDDEDNNKCQPGQERNTEVKDILDTLQDMSQESKVTLEK